MNLNQYFEKGQTYGEYQTSLESLLASGKTTGDNHSEAMLEYAKLSLSRMAKWNKRFSVPDTFDIKSNGNILALGITEGWCGDAGQSLPAISKMLDKADIPFHLVMRDENPELMDHYLTNGGRSIPIIVFFDKSSGKELAHWGPRPQPAQEILMEHKSRNPYNAHDFHVDLHKWYAVDKHKTLASEITSLLNSIV